MGAADGARKRGAGSIRPEQLAARGLVHSADGPGAADRAPIGIVPRGLLVDEASVTKRPVCMCPLSSFGVRRFLAARVAVCFAFACVSCSSAARFDIKLPPGAVGGSTSIATLGVFRGGRLDREAWADVTPLFTAAFPGTVCGPLSAATLSSAMPLDTQIDELREGRGGDRRLLEPRSAAHRR